MKILYITKSKPDYLQDIVYTGLVKVLGIDNIIEYPWNIRYHINFRDYPKNMGQMNGTFFRSIQNCIKPKHYDIVIVASSRLETLQHYWQIIKNIPVTTKTVFLDGSDMPEVAGDLYLEKDKDAINLYKKILAFREFDFIFKRECIINKIYAKNVYPLTFGFNLNHLPPTPIYSEYKYDVAFWAVESHPIRTKALSILDDKFDCKKNGTTRNQVMAKYKRKGQFYLKELSACKIGLNFRGAGWDTLRYWETAALGAFMISQKPEIQIEDNFTHGKNIIYCQNDLSDLVDLCAYYLKNENKRIEIAKNSKQHLMSYHTDINRAKTILTKVTNIS